VITLVIDTGDTRRELVLDGPTSRDLARFLRHTSIRSLRAVGQALRPLVPR
jgi:hypothetical protein